GSSGSSFGNTTSTQASPSSSNANSNSTASSDNMTIEQFVDKNKDGNVSKNEIMDAIDEYFEGDYPFSVGDIIALIDGFFD
ncbi:MAG: hypothetical protein MRY83_12360, partial [Flavobacteriales bacterium]|nr:hypothetical protein [Flavobacteriales bacterium]